MCRENQIVIFHTFRPFSFSFQSYISQRKQKQILFRIQTIQNHFPHFCGNFCWIFKLYTEVSTKTFE